MSTPERELAQRIRELRKRHFGPRGKDEFARRLGVARTDYDHFETGKLPPGELMVRMCELTGEDLQWLLTGISSRGTVVISGARNRHQDLITRIARALDARPRLATPLEAFFDLLLRGEDIRGDTPREFPTPATGGLIPLFAAHEWPQELPDPDDGPGGGGPLAPLPRETSLATAERVPAGLTEPALEYDSATLRNVHVLSVPDATGATRRFVQSREVADCFPAAFGVVLGDDAMEPMFTAGDALLVTVGAGPQLGRPALCKFADRADDCCRIWLGEDQDRIQLGRVSDGQHQQMPRAQLRWSLEVLYRVSPAA
jgi:transcriptional regulator with XRE-family HTH domain